MVDMSVSSDVQQVKNMLLKSRDAELAELRAFYGDQRRKLQAALQSLSPLSA